MVTFLKNEKMFYFSHLAKKNKKNIVNNRNVCIILYFTLRSALL